MWALAAPGAALNRKISRRWRERQPEDFGRKSAPVRGPCGCCLAAAAVFVLLLIPRPSRTARPVKGEASFSVTGGYARLMFKLAEDVASQVTSAGSILIIRFERPVDIPIDRLGRVRARLCLLRAPRSRRHRDPPVAGAPGDHQHHVRGRADLRRPAAGQLDRSAAAPADRSGARACRAGEGGRAARSASSAPRRPPRSVRRSACAR